jgi:hypothetical protein
MQRDRRGPVWARPASRPSTRKHPRFEGPREGATISRAAAVTAAHALSEECSLAASSLPVGGASMLTAPLSDRKAASWSPLRSSVSMFECVAILTMLGIAT